MAFIDRQDPETEAPETPPGNGWGDHLPEVVTYSDRNFTGQNVRTNLNHRSVGNSYLREIGSVVVVAGMWRFFEKPGYDGDYRDFGPGYHMLDGFRVGSFKTFQPQERRSSR